MRELKQLFANNQAWAERIRAEDPEFFEKLSRQQAPAYFWIGCSDSRVPANQITGLLPGEMFVHRNVANVMPPGDLNSLSALHFAVEVLKVRHVIVCGHYGCAGVRAVLHGHPVGLAHAWLQNVDNVRRKHRVKLGRCVDDAERCDRLCELNVIEQVAGLCVTSIVQEAWERQQTLAVHGWIYSLADGLLRDLGLCITRMEELGPAYEAAIESRGKEVTGGNAEGRGPRDTVTTQPGRAANPNTDEIHPKSETIG
jgi:carbonic anhydrase